MLIYLTRKWLLLSCCCSDNWTFRSFVSLPPRRFAPRRFAPGHIQCFLLIQLKRKHHRLDVFNYSCHSVCIIKRLMYHGAKRLGSETSRNELTKGQQNVHKSLGEIPKQVTRRKTIKRTFFNISSNLAHFTDNFKTDLT